MALLPKERPVFWDKPVEKDVGTRFIEVQHLINSSQLENYTRSIEDFLYTGAHECTLILGGESEIFRYDPEPLVGFGRLSVYFSVYSDKDGEYILIDDCRIT